CKLGWAQNVRAYNDKLRGEARANRFVVFSATRPDQLAEEHTQYEHGLFTYALAHGLKGDAMDRQERTVRVSGLGFHVTREVRRLSEGRQEPEFSSGIGDIVLVRR